MYCTKCKTKTMNAVVIVDGLKGYHCNNCDGYWIKANDYYDYVENSEDNDRESDSSVEYKVEYDSKKASFCPDCGSIMIKYRVSNDIPFNIDHCGNCHGVWLDKNEWMILVENKLHKSLNNVFTDSWQKELRDAMTRDHFKKHYEERFGQAGYARIKEIREWIYSSGMEDGLIAYLVDEDPYKL